MYKCLHGNIIAGEQMLISKSTYIAAYSLPQSVATCSDYFKVANLKQSKVRIVQPA